MSTIISLTKAFYISMYWNSTIKGMIFGRGYGWLSCGVYGYIGIFSNAISNAEEIFCMAQLRVWAWMKHKSTKVNFSFSDWCICPIHCIGSIT